MLRVIRMPDRALRILAAVVIWCSCVSAATQVILLGTGTPAMDPDRSGPATAIVVGDTAYLIDFGPGVVRRAAAAAAKGIPAVRPENLKTAFLTHLHSDHTVGYPDLIFTPWVMARKDTLNVYGPKGLKAMTDHILAAWQEDINIRTKGLEQRWPLRVAAHEIKPGIVYTDALVRVTAFPVPHGEWDEAYGYRFDTPDRVIVISGDTRPSAEIVKACRRCDILIHEVYPMGSRATMPDWPKYRAQYHTSTQELAEICEPKPTGAADRLSSHRRIDEFLRRTVFEGDWPRVFRKGGDRT
jgi:ribonuclease BN (tRNA processing enzyme)